MTKLDLITGILGSGKTTFIRKYANYCTSQGEKIAILENDFGAVNVDMILLQDLASDKCRLEMVMGGGDSDCHKRRFKTRLISLGMEGFDRIIIEPSGIFDMDEFFDSLYESPLCNWYQVGSVIAILDSTMDDDLSDEMEFLLGSEISCCGKVVVSKLKNNILEPNLIKHINNSMEYIKCDRHFDESDFISKKWDDLTDEDFKEIQSSSYKVKEFVKLYTKDSITSNVYYFMNMTIKDQDKEKMLSEIINNEKCGHIYRIKGSLERDDNTWLKINFTSKIHEIEAINNGQSVLIVIGDKLNKNQIDDIIRKYNSNSEYVSI